MFLLWKDFSCNLGSLRLPKKKLLLSFQLNAFINSWQIWWFLLEDYLFNYFYLLMQKNLLINFSTLIFLHCLFVIDCVTFIRVFGSIWGEIGYLAFVKMCLFFSYFFCCQVQQNQMNDEIFHISLILSNKYHSYCFRFPWIISIYYVQKYSRLRYIAVTNI